MTRKLNKRKRRPKPKFRFSGKITAERTAALKYAKASSASENSLFNFKNRRYIKTVPREKSLCFGGEVKGKTPQTSEKSPEVSSGCRWIPYVGN